ncbi:hypothetical protein [Thalassiella azotivora]
MLELAERAFYDPWSHARAHLLGGDEWSKWLGWTPEASRIADLTDVLIAVNTEKKKKPERVPRPPDRSTARPSAASLEEAFALLGRMFET